MNKEDEKGLQEYLKDFMFEVMGSTPLAYYFIYYDKESNGKIKSLAKQDISGDKRAKEEKS